MKTKHKNINIEKNIYHKIDQHIIKNKNNLDLVNKLNDIRFMLSNRFLLNEEGILEELSNLGI